MGEKMGWAEFLKEGRLRGRRVNNIFITHGTQKRKGEERSTKEDL